MSQRDGLSGRGGPRMQGQAGGKGWQNADEKIAKRQKVGKRSRRKRGRRHFTTTMT